jgi:hypothetical protein
MKWIDSLMNHIVRKVGRYGAHQDKFDMGFDFWKA